MDSYKEKIEFQKCQKMADEIADEITLNQAVYEALCNVKRSNFTPSGMEGFAYKLDALPIKDKQWISSPLSVAKMTMALQLNGVDKVLEIGCGSGYQAAILAKIVRRVFSVERIEKLALEAKKRFKNLNIFNVNIRFDDGKLGWKSYAPYERILLSASIDSIPQTLFDQLEDGGILVAPMKIENKQKIVRFKKNANKLQKEILDSCFFVDIQNGREKIKTIYKL